MRIPSQAFVDFVAWLATFKTDILTCQARVVAVILSTLAAGLVSKRLLGVACLCCCRLKLSLLLKVGLEHWALRSQSLLKVTAG